MRGQPRDHPTAKSYLRAVGRVMVRITSNVDRQSVAQTAAEGLVADLGIDLVRIWLYDPADDSLHLRARAGLTELVPDFGHRWTLQDTHVPIVRAIQGRQPLVMNDIRTVPGFIPSSLGADLMASAGLHAYAGLPLLLAGRLGGGLSAHRRRPFPPALLDALDVLGQQVALALEHARLGVLAPRGGARLLGTAAGSRRPGGTWCARRACGPHALPTDFPVGRSGPPPEYAAVVRSTGGGLHLGFYIMDGLVVALRSFGICGPQLPSPDDAAWRIPPGHTPGP
jgi:hypothetical protein